MSNGGPRAGEITESLVPYKSIGWIVTCRRGGNRVIPLEPPSSVLGDLVDCKPDVWGVICAWSRRWSRVITGGSARSPV